jgi:hypothetical protein
MAEETHGKTQEIHAEFEELTKSLECIFLNMLKKITTYDNKNTQEIIENG